MRNAPVASPPRGGAGVRPSATPGIRIRRPARPLTGRWADLPVEAPGGTMLGISFRPLQAEALGLEPRAALARLLAYPFDLVRLAAYWDRLEPGPGCFEPGMLDWQVDAAERAGKKIIICAGAVKAFGYPEFFVPDHVLRAPLREGSLVTPQAHPELADAAAGFITRVVQRYRNRPAVIGWQVEHEAVDPLGMEHSWRLSAAFAEREAAAVRTADPGRPVVMNGFLATSLPVRLHQWWRTRDQGESLSVAQRLADVVGIDYYPRHALMPLRSRTVYLDGSRNPWQLRRRGRLQAQAASSGQRLMIAEGQAEPWETVTTPPSPAGRAMYSCLPEHVIGNYNECIRASREVPGGLWAYLLWGAEYWLLRERHGDPSYLQAAARVLGDRVSA